MSSEQDVLLLRRIAAGERAFNQPGDLSERAAFDDLCRSILALGEAGLITRPRVLRSGQGHGEFAKVFVEALTPRGQDELARHGPPSEALVEVVRQKIKHAFDVRMTTFRGQCEGIAADFSRRGFIRSTPFVQKVGSAIQDEYHQRAALALQLWEQVRAGRELPFSSDLAGVVRDEIRYALEQLCGDLEQALQHASDISGFAYTGGDAEALRRRAFDRAAADLDFAMITPAAVASPSGPTYSFTIHGNVGALQTGEQATATVSMNWGTSEQAGLLEALTELRTMIAGADGIPKSDRDDLVASVELAIEEGRKPKPNPVTLLGLLIGVSTAVQTLAALPGAADVAKAAYRLARVAAGHVGIQLP